MKCELIKCFELLQDDVIAGNDLIIKKLSQDQLYKHFRKNNWLKSQFI